MRTHKALRLIAAFLMPLSQTAFCDTKDANLDAIWELTRMAEQGPRELLAFINKGKIPTFPIRSAWFVECITNDAQRAKVEQARRDFGKAFLVSLETFAETLNAPAEAKDRENTAKLLLDLADWCVSKPGYGNVFLFNRLQDLASVPTAYLVVDMDVSADTIEPILSRLVSYPDDCKYFIAALNDESPVKFSTPLGVRPIKGVWDSDRSRINERWSNSLGGVWNANLKKIADLRKRNGMARPFAAGKEDRDSTPGNLAFFVDDDIAKMPKPGTTLNFWNVKFHSKLILGLSTQNNDYVKGTWLFRQKVGGFPTEPHVSWWNTREAKENIKSPIKAAFGRAWHPFAEEFDWMDACAVMVYEGVAKREFFDEDTKKIRLHEQISRSRDNAR